MLVEYRNVKIKRHDKEILDRVDFQVDQGEFIYLTGRVGSGKSSILQTLYAELEVFSGKAHVLGYDLTRIKRKHIPELRKQMGIVFQDFQLLTDRSVYKNLEFVLKATGWKKKKEIEKRISEVLDSVDLTHKMSSFPHELSGGEQQRVSIARAILNSPKMIIADEPTGNLDRETGQNIVNLLRTISQKGTAIIMSTHNLDLLQQFPGIVYRCEDGTLKEVTCEYNAPIELKIEEDNETTIHDEDEK